MLCKNCGANVGVEYRLCPYCHTELEYLTNNVQPTPQQPTIVINNVVNDHFQNQPPQPYQQPQPYPQQQPYYMQNNIYCSPKSKLVALILCIFFGFFGIHRFYIGKVGSGLLYFFTGGLFMLGWIYDIIKIASGTLKDGNGLPIINS